MPNGISSFFDIWQLFGIFMKTFIDGNVPTRFRALVKSQLREGALLSLAFEYSPVKDNGREFKKYAIKQERK